MADFQFALDLVCEPFHPINEDLFQVAGAARLLAITLQKLGFR
jgi:hypothetical protein